jgi:hypothetical protein
MDNALERKLFCCNFGGHWSVKLKELFCIPEEHADL